MTELYPVAWYASVAGSYARVVWGKRPDTEMGWKPLYAAPAQEPPPPTPWPGSNPNKRNDEPPVCPYCHRGGPARDVNEPAPGARWRTEPMMTPEQVEEWAASIPAPGASEDERLIADLREVADRPIAADSHGRQLITPQRLHQAAARLTALRDELKRFKDKYGPIA